MEMETIRILTEVKNLDCGIEISPLIGVPDYQFDIMALAEYFKTLQSNPPEEFNIHQKVEQFCMVLGFEDGVYKTQSIIASKRISMEIIHYDVAAYFDISPDLLRTRTRKIEIVKPRQFSMTLMSYLTNKTLGQIGGFYGLDHSTVNHSRDKAIPAYYFCRDTQIKEAIQFFNAKYGLATPIERHIKNVFS